MSKIQELSEQLANKIAAGEVVERAASVVKELVENAIDAESSQISIFLEESGMKKIQIVDNGEGIANDEVALAFRRHATSKIRDVNDLFRIQTLGFRGEALPSIASVSMVEVETAVKEAEFGTRLVIKGGEVVENSPAPLRHGTKITVENLFYNTPARLKYVKSLQAELARIGDIVNRLALSHPDIAFRLVHEGNEMLKTTGNGDLKVAIAGIYGMNTVKKMVEIHAEDLDFTVSGFVSLPELTRSSRNYISLLINGRFIKNFQLNKAITSGYGSKLMGGRFPIAVIDIQMDALLVDVNVHPTKQEVRLSKERELMGLITRAIQKALASERLIPTASAELKFRNPQAVKNSVEKPVQTSFEMADSKEKTLTSSPVEKTNSSRGNLGFDVTTGQFFVKEETTIEEVQVREESFTQPEKTPETSPTKEFSSVEVVENVNEIEESPEEIENALHPGVDFQHRTKAKKELEKIAELLSREEVTTERFPQLDYFGQMHGTYLFASSPEGLFIIDQHAAQERIKYEYYREEIGRVGDDRQELLLPIVLDYPNNDRLILKEKSELLEAIGLNLEEYGQTSFILRSHPTWFKAGREEKTARELIDMLLLTGEVSVKKFREETAIMMSCKRSIKANHYLNETQARVLLADLKKCKNPFNCPHGRPVLVHFSNYEMERLFKRIQDPHESFK
ncbi:DNA mismatch repair protein MutL [Pilibacter termitis]|uniref:DNA mismatch repair protein MutL n=1 Tax=Pilibacter termitis TaxID=263852 RepID=A0A1T4QVA1_9ENTE|nr:DNA mismatch repair endonuclease MutL [Pilibacter termitis]SKA07546.1 DNA mismatch repair protein MutL [Pilibacter termitis]